MKKLVFAIVAVVAVSFASCGGNANNAAVCDSDSCCGQCEDTTVVVEEDTTVADSTAAVAVDTAAVAE